MRARPLARFRVVGIAALFLLTACACSVRFHWPRHSVEVYGAFGMGGEVEGVDAHLTLSSIELIECRDEDEIVRPPGFGVARNLLIPEAAAHGPTTPTRIGATRVVLLPDHETHRVLLGEWTPNPGSYCSVRVVWSAADEDAEGLAQRQQMLGKTLMVTSDKDQILADTSASADAEITLSEPLVFGDEDDMSLRVTLSHMADSAEAMRPDLDEEGRGRLLLDALRQRVTVEVER